MTKNPHENTGKHGAGWLWYEGANYASDALVLREIGGILHMLAIKRRSGHWAMPGGFRERAKTDGPKPMARTHGLTEGAREAALRELREETGLALNAEPREVYSGYAPDARNTDDAWIETSVWRFDVIAEYEEDLTPTAGDDAQGAAWIPLRENLATLYPGHTKIITEILEREAAVRGG